jgi:hypothetical protein
MCLPSKRVLLHQCAFCAPVVNTAAKTVFVTRSGQINRVSRQRVAQIVLVAGLKAVKISAAGYMRQQGDA